MDGGAGGTVEGSSESTGTQGQAGQGSPSEHQGTVQRALGGDDRALTWVEGQLVRIPSYLQSINRRYGGALSEHDLEDLSQETMVRTWNKLETFAGTGTLGGWIYRFCLFDYLNGLRSKSRAPRTEPIAQDHPRPSHASDWDAEKLTQVLAQLPAKDAEVLQLRHFDALRFHEIAERLGLPLNTAKTRYYRALQQMRRLMATGTPEDPR